MRPPSPKPRHRQQLALDHVARANYGVLWNEVLDELEVTPAQRRSRVRRGEWERVERGVFLVCAVPRTWEQRLMVLCRRAPGRVWVACRAAAALWDLDGFESGIIEVATCADLRPRSGLEHIRRIRSLPRMDVTVRRKLPVTSVHRTLIDIGDVAPPEDVELAYECARRRRQTNEMWLNRRIDELGTKGRKGPAILEQILALQSRGGPTGSALEVRFLQFNRQFGLPEPKRQRIIRDRHGSVARVDFLYVGTNVVVEVDGRAFHLRRAQWERIYVGATA